MLDLCWLSVEMSAQQFLFFSFSIFWVINKDHNQQIIITDSGITAFNIHMLDASYLNQEQVPKDREKHGGSECKSKLWWDAEVSEAFLRMLWLLKVCHERYLKVET